MNNLKTTIENLEVTTNLYGKANGIKSATDKIFKAVKEVAITLPTISFTETKLEELPETLQSYLSSRAKAYAQNTKQNFNTIRAILVHQFIVNGVWNNELANFYGLTKEYCVEQYNLRQSLHTFLEIMPSEFHTNLLNVGQSLEEIEAELIANEGKEFKIDYKNLRDASNKALLEELAAVRAEWNRNYAEYGRDLSNHLYNNLTKKGKSIARRIQSINIALSERRESLHLIAYYEGKNHVDNVTTLYSISASKTYINECVKYRNERDAELIANAQQATAAKSDNATQNITPEVLAEIKAITELQEQGVSQREIAKILNMSFSTVKRRIRAAKEIIVDVEEEVVETENAIETYVNILGYDTVVKVVAEFNETFTNEAIAENEIFKQLDLLVNELGAE